MSANTIIKKSYIKLYVLMALTLALSALLAACGGELATPRPEAAVAATNQPAPTNGTIVNLPDPTATATATALPPTATSAPTATATATAIPPTATPAPPTATSAPTATATVRATATAAPTATPLPAYKPLVWFSSATAKPGELLTVGGSGFPPSVKLNIAFGANGQTPGGSFGTPLTDTAGKFATQVKLDKGPDGAALKEGRLVIAVSAPETLGGVSASAPVILSNSTATATPTTKAVSARPGKWIDINLSTQKLVAYEGGQAVYSTLISSGKNGYLTVTGEFKTYLKYREQDMRGGTGREAYNVPDVPYVMYFYADYAIHGAYWHNMFGKARMSHGCVNTPVGAAQFLYNWAPIGTPVSVHY